MSSAFLRILFFVLPHNMKKSLQIITIYSIIRIYCCNYRTRELRFPMLNAIRSGSMIEIILTAFSLLVMLFVVFPVHECSHALAAKLLGDDTAERQGRITLNPFAHLDLMGTIGILAFGIGWAKPVPVNPARCRKVSQKAAMAITAAAGPMANFVSSLIFMITNS